VIEYARRYPEDFRQEGLRAGFAKGREERLEEGLAKGRKEGVAEGREEERRILVKSLYDHGIAIEIIAVSVGLSEPAIRRLLDDMSDL